MGDTIYHLSVAFAVPDSDDLPDNVHQCEVAEAFIAEACARVADLADSAEFSGRLDVI